MNKKSLVLALLLALGVGYSNIALADCSSCDSCGNKNEPAAKREHTCKSCGSSCVAEEKVCKSCGSSCSAEKKDNHKSDKNSKKKSDGKKKKKAADDNMMF
ncbi:MAG TPA: hypothetical protein VJJ81_00480 [Candidatus Babeliales bacterium]|nr:hypothetical protein [Candidatus Babeliales bacterium]